ncbi:unnamed protein product [Mesocestoides corti]|uniref:Tyrosine-protein phosphatase domain-containing protein n=1 Tax=Mesocestoides corti TaxID=53468 RepID=A0A3P6I5W2_MESCO|nr:unnamed protein product [Mesocestoides corti]
MSNEWIEDSRNGSKASLCGALLGNVSKNRYKHILPYDNSRVILGRTWDEFQMQITPHPSIHSVVGNYINASYIGVCATDINGVVLPNESLLRPEFIVTQDPLETIGDFWQMVYEQRSPLIIRLSEAGSRDEEECVHWPQAVGTASFYQSQTEIWNVELLYQRQISVWTDRTFKVWPSGREDLALCVRHLQYGGWSRSNAPLAKRLLKCIDDVSKIAAAFPPTVGPVVVQSRGGIGRNGVFIVAYTLKCKIEQGVRGVDVYGLIKQLRKYQMGLVNALITGGVMVFTCTGLLFTLLDLYDYEFTDTPRQPAVWPLTRRLSGSAYELELNFNLEEAETNVTKYTVPDDLVLKSGARSVPLTHADLIGIPDNEWRLPIDPRVYLTYPQAINLSATVDNLMYGRPIQVAPIGDFPLRYLTLSKSVCHPDHSSSQNFDVVVVVKSGVSNFERRQNFRQLYGGITNANADSVLGLRIGLVFSVGIPRKQTNNIFQRGDRLVKLINNGGEFLTPEALHTVSQRVKEEIDIYDDLVVGDYEDTYFNLTKKTIYAFNWAASFCRRSEPTILFVDDDFPFSEKHLARALRLMTAEQRRNLLHGKLVKDGRVFRFGQPSYERWCLHKNEAPWPLFPTYAYGVCLLVGFPQVEKLALGMLFTQQFHVDDSWIGLIAAKLELQLQNIHDLFGRLDILRINKHRLKYFEKRFVYF